MIRKECFKCQAYVNVHGSGGSRGGSQGAMEPPFHSRLSTATVARLQLASQLIIVIELYLHTCLIL